MAEEEKKDDQKNKKEKGKKEKGNKGIDLGVPVGWIVGMVIVIAAIISAGGVEGAAGFFDIASILIVVGGYLSALIVNYGFKDMAGSFKVILAGLKKDKTDRSEIIEQFIVMAKKARAQGILSLEDDLKNIKDPYLYKGLKLAIDGYDGEEIRAIMEAELDCMQDRHAKGQEIMEKAGDFAPAWGMIGTLVGLVLMLRNLDDPSTLGPSMAVAMITTLYGAIIANLFAIPMQGKLERNSLVEVANKELILEGVLEIQRGQIPSKLKAKMDSYIDPASTKKKLKKESKKTKDGKEGEKKDG